MCLPLERSPDSYRHGQKNENFLYFMKPGSLHPWTVTTFWWQVPLWLCHIPPVFLSELQSCQNKSAAKSFIAHSVESSVISQTLSSFFTKRGGKPKTSKSLLGLADVITWKLLSRAYPIPGTKVNPVPISLHSLCLICINVHSATNFLSLSLFSPCIQWALANFLTQQTIHIYLSHPFPRLRTQVPSLTA